LEGWRLWADTEYRRWYPYVDEETDINEVTNTEDVRARIIADLEAGTALPNDMGQVGRFNKTVSQVLLAKAVYANEPRLQRCASIAQYSGQ
jgi:hypothetical protein